MRVYFRYTPGTTEKSQKKGLKKTKRALNTRKSTCTRSATVSARKTSRKGRADAKTSDHFASTPPESLPPTPSHSHARVNAGDENADPRDGGHTVLGMITVRKKVPRPASSERAPERSVLAPKYVPKSANYVIILTGIAEPLNLSRKTPFAWTSCSQASMRTKSRCFSLKAFYVLSQRMPSSV